MNKTVSKFIPNEARMLEFGQELARAMLGDTEGYKIIFLNGQLGAGKTTLSRGILRGFGYEGRVKSPTYTIVEPYELTECVIYHFDLYRLQHPSELESMGIQDYLIPHAICLIEWPEHGEGYLPLPDLSCHIRMQNDSREITLTAHSSNGETLLQRIPHDD